MVIEDNNLLSIVYGQASLQFIAALLGDLNVLSSGIHYGWSSPSLPKLRSNETHLSLTETEISWVPVPMQFGGLSGAILCACFINKIGRKRIILIAGVLFAAASLLIALGRSFIILLIARFVAGLADGITYSSIPIYIVEISNPKIRGGLLSVISIAWCTGVLFMNTLGSYTSIPTAAYVSLAICLIFLMTFPWMPETPYHLIMTGDFEDARSSLRSFSKYSDLDTETELNRLTEVVNVQRETFTKFVHLFTVKAYRRSLLIMIGIKSAQQCCGFTSIMFYAQMIFEEAGSLVSAKATSVIYFGLFLIASTICSLIVDKIGRKPLLIASCVGTGVSMFVLATYLCVRDNTNTSIPVIPLTSFLVYITFYAIGLHTVGMSIISEIFPLSIRPIGLSAAIIYYEGISAIVVQVFQISKDTYGLYVLFYVYAMFCVLGLLFVVYCVPETTGITLEEIEDNLSLQ